VEMESGLKVYLTVDDKVSVAGLLESTHKLNGTVCKREGYERWKQRNGHTDLIREQMDWINVSNFHV